MNNQKICLGARAATALTFPLFRFSARGIAREITVVVGSKFQRQVVHRMTEFEELYVGLNPQPESRGGSFIQIF